MANVTPHNRLARTQNRFDLNNLSERDTYYNFKGRKMFILLVGLLHVFVIPHNSIVGLHSPRARVILYNIIWTEETLFEHIITIINNIIQVLR